jgi:hypothetical protein
MYGIRLVVMLGLLGVLCAASLSAGLSMAGAFGGQSAAASPPARPLGCIPWQIVSSPNIGSGVNWLYGVSALAPDDAWAVGFQDSGSVPDSLTLHWDGVQWSTVAGPQGNIFLYDVEAVSHDDVWAAGSPSLIQRWDGGQWSIISHPAPPGPGTGFSDVEALTAQDVWVVGSYNEAGQGRTLIEHWNGQSWSIVPSPNVGAGGNGLSSITAIAPDDIWAVGTYYQSTRYNTLIMHWDGTAWSVVPSPSPSPSRTSILTGVTAISSGDVWAVGHYYIDSAYRTLTLHWDGQAWTQVASPNVGAGDNYLYGVAAISSGNVWAVGFRGSQPLTIHWDGTQWAEVQVPVFGGSLNTLQAVAVVPSGPTDLWAVGSQDATPAHRTLTLRFDPNCATVTPTPTPTGTPPTATPTQTPVCGAAWTIVSSPDPGAFQYLNGVAANNTNDVWMVGSYNYPGPNTTLVLHWDGRSLTRVPAPTVEESNSYLNAVTAISTTDVWAVGTGGSGPVALHWDGWGWALVSVPAPGSGSHALNGVDAIGAGDVWAVGEYYTGSGLGTFIVHWDGEGWGVVPSPSPGLNHYLTSVTAIATNDAWAAGYYYSTGGASPQPLTLHWDGTAWSVVPVPPSAFSQRLHGVAATSPNSVWAVGQSNENGTNKTLILRWDGTAWSRVPSPNINGNGVLRAVATLPGGEAWAVGYGVDEHGWTNPLAMRWDEAVWTMVPAQTIYQNPAQFHAVAAISPGDVWAVGYRNTLSGITPLRTHVQHYADPCTQCTITFSDVRQSEYFYEAVRYLYCAGVISGYSGGTFRPYNFTTRGQLSKIVVLAEAWPLLNPPEPRFSDVSRFDPIYRYVETAAGRGIISGYADGTFRPGNHITRGQLAKIIVLAEGWELLDPPVPTFSDVPRGQAFYQYIETAADRGIITGYSDGTFRLGNSATRGQIAKIVHKAVTAP